MAVIDKALLYILLATLLSGTTSLVFAAIFSYSVLSRVIDRMVSLSVGIMLATSFMHALPEAFESGINPHYLFATLLAGLLSFFLLEKMALLRHSHHHEGDMHDHQHPVGFDAQQAGKSGWMILVGDGLHNFSDGILIAAAFLTDPKLGLMTSLAIFAHEVPQEVGDFIVLLNAGFSRRRAFVYNLLSSLAAIIGGIAGYVMLKKASNLIPYVLVLASSGFIYISVSDLMPQMQQRYSLRETVSQVLLIALGIGIIFVITGRMHMH